MGHFLCVALNLFMASPIHSFITKLHRVKLNSFVLDLITFLFFRVRLVANFAKFNYEINPYPKMPHAMRAKKITPIISPYIDTNAQAPLTPFPFVCITCNGTQSGVSDFIVNQEKNPMILWIISRHMMTLHSKSKASFFNLYPTMKEISDICSVKLSKILARTSQAKQLVPIQLSRPPGQSLIWSLLKYRTSVTICKLIVNVRYRMPKSALSVISIFQTAKKLENIINKQSTQERYFFLFVSFFQRKIDEQK